MKKKWQLQGLKFPTAQIAFGLEAFSLNACRAWAGLPLMLANEPSKSLDAVFDGRTMNDSGWIIPVLVVGGVAIFLGVFLGICLHFDKKRRLQWLEVAGGLGFDYLTAYPDDLDGIVRSSRLMTTGRQRAWTNIYRRQTDSLDVTLCDFRYTVGHGKTTRVWQQSVILFSSPTINAPSFELQPEGWLNKLGEMLGGQDIDFTESPEFSKKYILRGDDEDGIRQFMNASTLQLLAGFQHLCLEVRPGSLMFWFDRRRISPQEFNTVFEQACSICEAMSQSP